MKVTYKQTNGPVMFKDLPVGTIFKSGTSDALAIKTDGDADHNAVILVAEGDGDHFIKAGEPTCYGRYSTVWPVKELNVTI